MSVACRRIRVRTKEQIIKESQIGICVKSQIAEPFRVTVLIVTD